jgi:hypothetical protein
VKVLNPLEYVRQAGLQTFGNLTDIDDRDVPHAPFDARVMGELRNPDSKGARTAFQQKMDFICRIEEQPPTQENQSGEQ